MAEETALDKRKSSELSEVPDFLKGVTGKTGMEHVTRDDMQIPRIALAQGLSPQIDPEKPEFIEGLRKGEMFNSLNRDLYGKGPIRFTVLRADPPRYIEFIPRSEGGGVRDMNVPPNDPRTQFRKGPNNEPLPPIATKFYDFLILTFPLGENPIQNVMALSLKSSMLGLAKNLNTMMMQRNKPSFTGLYELGTASKTNAKGTFSVFTIKNLGWVRDEKEFRVAEAMHRELQGKSIVIDREPGSDDDIEFAEPTAAGEM